MDESPKPTVKKKSDDPCWFVCFVKPNQEKIASEQLSRLGFQNYLPIVKEYHKWSDRMKLVDRVVIPRMIFIRCAPSVRLEPVRQIPSLRYYMSSGRGPYNPAVIPDAQMEAFMAMVASGDSSVAVVTDVIAPGDTVLVTEGPLVGYKCQVSAVSGKKCYVVPLGAIGSAIMEIRTDLVGKVKA